jgi:hypothetical protein
MGGEGSGRPKLHYAVEDCQRVSAHRLVRGQWGDEPGREGLMAHLVARVDGKDFRQACRMHSTPCRFGGRRWWFDCPGCRRRVARLYVPPGRPWFRCRRCHGLTYRSCQERRRWGGIPAGLLDRLEQMPGGLHGLSREEVGRLLGPRR